MTILRVRRLDRRLLLSLEGLYTSFCSVAGIAVMGKHVLIRMWVLKVLPDTESGSALSISDTKNHK